MGRLLALVVLLASASGCSLVVADRTEEYEGDGDGDNDVDGDADADADADGDCDDEELPDRGNCLDGVDNDCDGWLDCNDQDCYSAAECGGGVCEPEDSFEACTDGRDNDFDCWTDCADVECAAFDVCQIEPEGTNLADCLNGEDDDRDLSFDCVDWPCLFLRDCDPACQEGSCPAEDCDDYYFEDEDGDGLSNCADPDCWEEILCAGCQAEICGDFLDNNCDGVADEEATCGTYSSCEAIRCAPTT
jgi:hypothetical protein